MSRRSPTAWPIDGPPAGGLVTGRAVRRRVTRPAGACAGAARRGGVGGDPVDPGRERRPAVEAGQAADDRDQGLLGGVERVGVVAGQPAADAVDPRPGGGGGGRRGLARPLPARLSTRSSSSGSATAVGAYPGVRHGPDQPEDRTSAMSTRPSSPMRVIQIRTAARGAPSSVERGDRGPRPSAVATGSPHDARSAPASASVT